MRRRMGGENYADGDHDRRTLASDTRECEPASETRAQEQQSWYYCQVLGRNRITGSDGIRVYLFLGTEDADGRARVHSINEARSPNVGSHSREGNTCLRGSFSYSTALNQKKRPTICTESELCFLGCLERRRMVDAARMQISRKSRIGYAAILGFPVTEQRCITTIEPCPLVAYVVGWLRVLAASRHDTRRSESRRGSGTSHRQKVLTNWIRLR